MIQANVSFVDGGCVDMDVMFELVIGTNKFRFDGMILYYLRRISLLVITSSVELGVGVELDRISMIL